MKSKKLPKWMAEKPLFLEPTDKRYQILEKQIKSRGFCSSELWNLDFTIACFILPRLKAFRKKHFGYPADLTPEKWNEILDKMILAFEYVAQGKMYDDVKDDDYKEGIKLFAKYFMALWD